MSDNFLFIFSFIAGINLLLLSVYGWIIKHNEKPFFWLSCMAFSAAIAIINNILIFNQTALLLLHHLSMTVNLAWGAYFYFLITRLKRRDAPKLMYFLFAPSVVYLFYGFITSFIPGYNINLLQKFYSNEIEPINLWANFFIVIYSVGMNLALLFIELKKSRIVKNETDQFKKNRIEILLTILILQLATFIPYFIKPDVILLVVFMPGSTLIFYFWLFLRMHQIMKTVSKLTFEMPHLQNLFIKKYKNLKLDEAKKEAIAQEIIKLFKESKPFLQDNYSIIDLSEEIKQPSHVVSMIINSKFNTSFPDFVNKYRIEESVLMLKDEKNYKIEAIAYECGFGNKASFYKAFKKFTGVTPANFKKTV